MDGFAKFLTRTNERVAPIIFFARYPSASVAFATRLQIVAIRDYARVVLLMVLD